MRGRRVNGRIGLPLFGLLVVASVTLPVPAALGAYSVDTETSYTSSVAPEAVELADLVPSPTHPNWYWSVSDVWKTTDNFSACAGTLGTALSDCQQVQRARVWAFKLDPVTHVIEAQRSFAVSRPSWALDPYIAQNNDWEDMALGPVRVDADGTPAANLIIGATGNAVNNPVRDSNGTDISCDTRRLIELREPDLSNPDATVWSPVRIYDLANVVSKYGKTACNMESLVQAPDASGQPTAYMVTRSGGKVFGRSLDVTTGRDPTTPRASMGTELPFAPNVNYVGRVPNSAGAQFTAADTNGQDIALLSPASSTKPCQLFTWSTTTATLARTITSVPPVKDSITCSGAEGLTYTRDPNDATAFTRDLYAIADLRKPTLKYWFLPAS